MRRRWWPGFVLVGTALVLASCTNTEGDEALNTALEALNQSVADLNSTAGDLETSLHDLEMRVEVAEQNVSSVALDFSRVGPSRASALPLPPDGKVMVQFIAEAQNAAIPGTFRFFLAPEGEPLFETRSLEAGEPYEVGVELIDGIVPVDPGVLYMLKVVYENPTEDVVEFRIPGGTLDPQAALQYVRNRCMCAAIPFTVPASGTWTRVIEVGVGPDTPPGARAAVIWPVVRTN